MCRGTQDERPDAARPSDIEVVTGCLEDRPGAWDRFCAVFGDDILRTARRTLARMGPASRGIEAEDVRSRVFEALLANDRRLLRSLREPFHLGAWLATIAARTCFQGGRRRGDAALPLDAAKVAGSDGGGPAQAAEESETAALVREAVGSLPPRDRDVLRMYYVDGRAYREIARECGLSEQSVGQIKNRARQALAKELRRRGIVRETP